MLSYSEAAGADRTQILLECLRMTGARALWIDWWKSNNILLSCRAQQDGGAVAQNGQWSAGTHVSHTNFLEKFVAG
jgi:hypothetical protein